MIFLLAAFTPMALWGSRCRLFASIYHHFLNRYLFCTDPPAKLQRKSFLHICVASTPWDLPGWFISFLYVTDHNMPAAYSFLRVIASP